MDDNEAILLVGAERFSDYRGYCDTLRWQYRKCCADTDGTKRDAMGRAVNTEVLAIDALCFAGPMNIWGGQFGEEAIKRELLKAYVGFALRTPESPPCIATGNWGCGAFGGDLELKSLIQWMAACLVRPRARPLLYYTFGNNEFATA
uniref:Poly(ADP-ribose) glycohydrolase n=1 Tax=Globodera pallida TaxID=36090 RepID=A0A183CF80_GLOPA